MKKLLRIVIFVMLAGPVSLTGCTSNQHPAYSSNVKYGLRNDPILKPTTNTNDLGDERYEPEQPGVFPLMTYAEIFKPEHPLHAKSEVIKQRELFRDPTKLASASRKDLEQALETVFGTPGAPTVNAKLAGVEDADIAVLKLDDKTLAEGSTRYRVHCLHCHGVPGDGRGPTARWINPHPRDFRLGKFKFQSVSQADGAVRFPARADLLRTLRHGIEGTAMPSFALLQDHELESLVSYVIHLSIRGKAESDLIVSDAVSLNDKTGFLEWSGVDDEDKPLSILDAIKTATKRMLKNPARKMGWADSQDPALAIKPGEYPYSMDGPEAVAALKASVSRGQQIFLAKPSPEFIQERRARLLREEADKAIADKKLDVKDRANVEKELESTIGAGLAMQAENKIKSANCVSCHSNYGREAKFRFDSWATLVRPNNFTQGVFRGGRRPIDLYYRVHSGINGSNMTPFGESLQSQDIWDVVNFVSVLSYPGMREKLGINLD